MEPSNEFKKYESDLGIYWLDSEGILNCKSKGPRRTIENVRANIELVKSIMDNKTACLLIHLCRSPIPTKETRNYVNKELPNVYKAMAMVSKSGLGKIIINFLFAMNSPPIPMKTFSNEIDARNWIKNYL